MTDIKLKAEQREETGRKVKSLRKSGILPGNIYGKKVKSFSVKISQKEFEDIYKQAGETSLVKLVVDKEERPVLIHNLQTDPVTDKPLHVDFLQVDLKEKVTAQVPVELIGESPAEKQGLGTVVQQIDEVETESLPTDIPDKFSVDISILDEVDKAIFIKDLKVDKTKVEIKDNEEEIIAKVEPLREEEVVAPPTAEAVEGVEGEVPTEGGEVKEEKPTTEDTPEPKDQATEGQKDS